MHQQGVGERLGDRKRLTWAGLWVAAPGADVRVAALTFRPAVRRGGVGARSRPRPGLGAACTRHRAVRPLRPLVVLAPAAVH